MSVVECLAWAGGTWMAIAIAAAWIKHRTQQRNRARRVKQQREQRIADVNARLRGTPMRPVRLDDIAHLDKQLTDLDQLADTIQPLYVQEGDR